ncbi:MAG: sodium ion-translocating decarboxylase subunit beta, partial [Clostridia bacterium]|nr:sodium ion-translocating decarboxylase subunit beta [Clostridia bacterium]
MLEQIINFLKTTGFFMLFENFLADKVVDGAIVAVAGWKTLTMILVSLLLLWLAIKKQFEPLLLIGIAFGMLLTNLPGAEMYHSELWTAFMAGEIGYGTIMHDGGLLDILYIGVKTCVYPCLIFVGIGAMTDFG